METKIRGTSTIDGRAGAMCRHQALHVLGASFPNPPALPRAVSMRGFVGMLMDISSAMVHRMLPMFLVSSRRFSVIVVGVIEGIPESTALVVKVFSGVLGQQRLGWAFPVSR